MNRYQFMKQLGDGTYGSVILATTVETHEKVAIKKMKKKYYSWDECLNLREVKSLRKLNHANIVKLKEVIRENDMLYFVFEYMKENLYQMMKDRDKLFPEQTVRNIMYQVLQGLAFMHKHGYFHRDMKPENLLCSGPDLVKIADFGLARETRSRPPYTDYVSTRWYRAPEVLLRSTNYNSPIDIWALGCIWAEVYTLRPLFPGSSEIDQLFKNCSVLGTPTKNEWPEGHKLAAAMNFRWPQMVATPLKQLIPNAGADGLQLLRDTLHWCPEKRPTAQQALRHNYFKVGQNLNGPKVTTPQSRPVQQPVSVESKPYQAKHQPSFGSQQSVMSKPSPVKPNPLDALENKAAPSHTENSNKADTFGNKKSGRRRWGGFGDTSTDDWLDDLDLSVSMKKPAATKPVKQTRKDDDDDDDFFSSSFGPKRKALPSIGGAGGGGGGRINSGRSSASSAKQLYMSKSRYMPGKNPMDSARGKENNGTTGNNWNSPLSKAYGGMSMRAPNPIGPSFGSSNSGYVPSSFSGSGQPNKATTNYRTGGWKRAEPAPLYNKHSGTKQPIGAGTGRTDWASKYLK